MGEKDITQRALQMHADVFADIINVGLHGSGLRVRPDELEPVPPRMPYVHDGEIREVERDVVMHWKGVGALRLATFGLEDQTRDDRAAVPRIGHYDFGEYYRETAWIKEMRERARNGDESARGADYYPVATFVLHYDPTKRWSAPTTLHELLGTNLPNALKPYVGDYHINVIDLAFLTDEQVSWFTSDFKYIVEALSYARLRKPYYFTEQLSRDDYKPQHIKELAMALDSIKKDKRFLQAFQGRPIERKEDMISALDLADEEMKAEAARVATEKAARETRERDLREFVGNMLGGGFDAQTAARMCGVTVGEVESIAADLGISLTS